MQYITVQYALHYSTVCSIFQYSMHYITLQIALHYSTVYTTLQYSILQKLSSFSICTYKELQAIKLWVWTFLKHLQTTSEIGESNCENDIKNSLITENLSLQIYSIYRHKKFRSLRRILSPTFNVRLESLLHFMSSNTTNCLVELWGNGAVEEKEKA